MLGGTRLIAALCRLDRSAYFPVCRDLQQHDKKPRKCSSMGHGCGMEGSPVQQQRRLPRESEARPRPRPSRRTVSPLEHEPAYQQMVHAASTDIRKAAPSAVERTEGRTVRRVEYGVRVRELRFLRHVVDVPAKLESRSFRDPELFR